MMTEIKKRPRPSKNSFVVYGKNQTLDMLVKSTNALTLSEESSTGHSFFSKLPLALTDSYTQRNAKMSFSDDAKIDK